MALPDHLQQLAAKVSNAGRWGPDDQRGTLNLVDATAVLRGVAAARQGRVFSLAIPFDEDGPQTGQTPGRENPARRMLAVNAPYTGDPTDFCASDDALAMGARVRLCKGAYKEPEEVAFPDKRDVDANFVRLTKKLLKSGIYHGVATHDEKMIAATKEFAAAEGVSRDASEFQMLYGIRRDLQFKLAQDGYRMRIYVPYGEYWYPYFMRRLAERPANVWFVLKNLFKG